MSAGEGASRYQHPPQNSAYRAAQIPGARRLVYQGVGHIPIVERADVFNRDVLALLSGGSDGDAPPLQ